MTGPVFFKRSLRFLCSVAAAAAAAFFIISYLDGNFHSLESVKTYIRGFGFLAPLILCLLQLFQVIFPILPGFLGCAAGAVLFGAAGGFWISYTGICAGSLLAFLTARRFGACAVRKRIGEANYARYLGWTQKGSFLWIFSAAILLPFAPDDILCFLAGLTPMPARRFTLLILLAKPWCILFYSLFFSRLL